MSSAKATDQASVAVKSHLSGDHVSAAAFFARSCAEIEVRNLGRPSDELRVQHRSFAIGAVISAVVQEALELTPERESLYHHYAVMLFRRGQLDSAAAILDRYVPTPDWHHGWLYAAAGRRDKGQQILDSLLKVNSSRPVDPLFIAALHAGLRNTEEALRWLDRVYADRSALLLCLLGPHPAFDPLRGDPDQ